MGGSVSLEDVGGAMCTHNGNDWELKRVCGGLVVEGVDSEPAAIS